MSEPANVAPSAADALPLPRMRPTTQGDPMNGHWPFCPAASAPHVGRFRAIEPTGPCTCAPQRPTDAPTCQDTPDTSQPATEAYGAADTRDLIDRAAHLARLGWAVEKLKAQGAVEFTLTQIEDAAREAGETK